MPAQTISAIERNKVVTATARQESLLGKQAWGHDLASMAAASPRTQREVTLQFVENAHTAALLPRRCVKYKSGHFGLRLNGYTGAGDKPDGVIDHLAPSSGIPAGGKGWMVISGPCEFETDGNDTLTAGNALKTAATGYVRLQTASADDIIAQAGICESTSIATGTAGLDVVGFFRNV